MLNAALIREARDRRDLSQAALADLLGVVELTVWRWENKPTKRLDYQTVRGLADVLGIDEESLFIHDPEADTPSTGRGKRHEPDSAVVEGSAGLAHSGA